MTTHHIPERRVLRRAPRRAFPTRHMLFEDDEIDVEIMGLGYEVVEDRDGGASAKR